MAKYGSGTSYDPGSGEDFSVLGRLMVTLQLGQPIVEIGNDPYSPKLFVAKLYIDGLFA